MLSTPPTSARLRLTPSIIPAASMAPIMLVAQAITVENAGIFAGAPASIHISRAMLLQVKLGTTVPQTQKSGWALASPPSMCPTTGTDRAMASSLPRGPSTFANGVLTPAANQTSGCLPLRAAICRTSPVSRRSGSARPSRDGTRIVSHGARASLTNPLMRAQPIPSGPIAARDWDG